MLKDHSYLFALPVNIDFHIRKVYSVIKHLAGRRILHTVKATKQRAFAGTRRPYYNYLFALLYFKVNTLSTERSPKLLQRSMTSITLLQAPFHNLNEEADYQHHQNINDCHNKIRHHKFIAVAAYIVECNVKVGSADKAYYRCLFYKRDEFVAERRQNIFIACGMIIFIIVVP